jgi:hypothetical protein
MNQPLELEDIAGLSLTITGTLIESYIKEGYADPTMYRALRASAELAEHFVERAKANGASDELIEGITELLTSLRITAMECGEVVNNIIDEHGLPVDKETWSKPHHNCDHDHNGED